MIAEPTATPMICTIAALAFAGIVTDEGTVATPGLLELSVTTRGTGVIADRLRVTFCAVKPRMLTVCGEKPSVAVTCTDCVAVV